jgi:hypothetical protein
VTAVNVTGNRKLQRADGTADYNVEVAINSAPPIWRGSIHGHKRKEGAAALLRHIADHMDQEAR